MSQTDFKQLLHQAAQRLPAQGTLGSFVHHNTLHSFEHLPFETALEQASTVYHCQVYRSEAAYQKDLQQGRIRHDDLVAVIQEALSAQASQTVAGLASHQEIWLSLMTQAPPEGSAAEIQWLISAGNGIQSFQQLCPLPLQQQLLADTRQWVMRDLRKSTGALAQSLFRHWDARHLEHWDQNTWTAATLHLLWELCQRGTAVLAVPDSANAPVLRLRDLIWQHQRVDLDLIVNEVLVSFCASFCDQGLAAWPFADSGKDFFAAFYALYSHPGPAQWQQILARRLTALSPAHFDPEALISVCFDTLGIPSEAVGEYILQTLLALRGWAGMIWQLETQPERALKRVPSGTLMHYLAVRLLLEACVAECLQDPTAPCSLHAWYQRLCQQTPPQDSNSLSQSYLIFWLAQRLGWSPRQLARLDAESWQQLIQSLPTRLMRQRLLQRAYERRYRHQILDAFSQLTPVRPQTETRPSLQVITCLDEREESFRRHLESVCPTAKTYGAAGYFGVAMAYQGLEDLHAQLLCPVSVQPRHKVIETVHPTSQAQHQWYSTLRRYRGRISYGLQRSSQGFWLGLLTHWLGALMVVPLVLRVLFPALSARLDQRLQHWLTEERQSSLQLKVPAKGQDPDALQAGFTVAEMADIVARLLRQLGLTHEFARLIMLIGHGSSSLNNPHEAAYNCGACGGGKGGPNARAFAQMANDPEVRQCLLTQGLVLPPDTVFLGAQHNTCNDEIHYYDLHSLPETHQPDFEQARSSLQQACEHNAHERVRRFESVPLLLSPLNAWKQVHARAKDLAQPRPEYGHAGNAFCLIGRRERSRSLFLDRRAFLASYDASQDPEAQILSDLLAAVLPVCTGINLEYYFSAVDNTGWGCGTKLPHNITGLLGVMDGAGSDLRTGLSRQMIEIHEAMRLLVIVESPPERLQKALSRHPDLERLCHNGWLQLACLNPGNSDIHCLQAGTFQRYIPEAQALPFVKDSAAWYSGLREHLGLARLQQEIPHVR